MKPLRHGVLLREARENAKLSLSEAAKRERMSVSQLSEIERGIGPLSLARARQLADAYGVDARPILEAVLQDRLEDAGFDEFRVIVTVSAK